MVTMNIRIKEEYVLLEYMINRKKKQKNADDESAFFVSFYRRLELLENVIFLIGKGVNSERRSRYPYGCKY